MQINYFPVLTFFKKERLFYVVKGKEIKNPSSQGAKLKAVFMHKHQILTVGHHCACAVLDQADRAHPALLLFETTLKDEPRHQSGAV